MTTPADIFDTLAQLPDRTPEQRTADERSAAILREARRYYVAPWMREVDEEAAS